MGLKSLQSSCSDDPGCSPINRTERFCLVGVVSLMVTQVLTELIYLCWFRVCRVMSANHMTETLVQIPQY